MSSGVNEKGLHEGCLEQIVHLCRDRVYAKGSADSAKVPVDEAGRMSIIVIHTNVSKRHTKFKNTHPKNNFTNTKMLC